MSSSVGPKPLTFAPVTQAFIAKLAAGGGPPLYTLSPTDARAVLTNVQASVAVTKLPADIEDRMIPGGPTGEVSIRIVRPQGATGAWPVVMDFHVGGSMPGV